MPYTKHFSNISDSDVTLHPDRAYVATWLLFFNENLLSYKIISCHALRYGQVCHFGVKTGTHLVDISKYDTKEWAVYRQI